MSKSRTNLVNTLLAVGALGATAGMMAWRWSQRRGVQRAGYHRDLNRWEGEGGAVADSSESPTTAMSAGSGAASGENQPGVAAANGAHNGNGATQMPWPFPHGHA